MNTTKLLSGTVIGAIVAFIMGYLIFGLALNSYMAENTNSTGESPDFLWLILGHVVLALFYTYVFLQWAGIKTAAGGAKAAAIMTLLLSLGSNWIWYATSGLFTGGIAATVVDAVGATIVWAVAGAAIGWMLGRGE